MTRGRALTKGQRSVQTAIRWSAHDWQRLRARADLQGLPVSEAVRRFVSACLDTLDNDNVKAQESSQ